MFGESLSVVGVVVSVLRFFLFFKERLKEKTSLLLRGSGKKVVVAAFFETIVCHYY